MSREDARQLARAAADGATSLSKAGVRRPSPGRRAAGPLYSGRLASAFAFAAQRHETQLRKATRIPYLTHLMAVAALVGEHGGTEDEMIAALLHDTVEDTGGGPVLDEIRRLFGPAVARLVEGCTDDAPLDPDEKAPWLERKTRYLSRICDEPASVLRISAADKVHNLRTIVEDLRRDGPAVLERFNGGRDGVLWYHRSLCDIFCALATEPEVDAGLRRLCDLLRREYGWLEAELAARSQC